MKTSDKLKYVAAMLPIIGARCKGKSWPIVMDGMALMNEACRRADLPHCYGSGQSKQVVADLFEELDRQCFAHEQDDSFPVKALKCTESIVRKIGHGKQLVVDADHDAKFYSDRAYPRKTDGLSGFVFFGRDAFTEHPIVAAGELVRSKAVSTEANRINGRVHKLKELGMITDDEKSGLLIGESKRIGIQ